jgi:hypothetical protein
MPKIYHNPPYERIDCGSGYHYGICPKCGQGHGHVLVSTVPEKQSIKGGRMPSDHELAIAKQQAAALR